MPEDMPDVPIIAMAEENDGEMLSEMRGWQEATRGEYAMQIYRTGGHLFPCEESHLGGSDLFMRRLVALLCALTSGGTTVKGLANGRTNGLVERLSEKQAVTMRVPGAGREGFNEAKELGKLFGEFKRSQRASVSSPSRTHRSLQTIRNDI